MSAGDASPRTAGPAVWGLVLAAGAGTRFGAPKQFAWVDGARLVDHAVRAVRSVCDGVVVALPAGVVWDGAPVAATVTGGRDRLDSSAAALAAVPRDAELVVIHDAAHPWAEPALFAAVVAAVARGEVAAAAGLALADVVARARDGHVAAHVGRDGLVVIQSPMAARARALRAAHRRPRPAGAVEDTALLTAAGCDVAIVAGSPGNHHVTTAADLAGGRGLTAAGAPAGGDGAGDGG